MEMLTNYLKEIAFDPMRARAIQNAPTSLKEDVRLSSGHVDTLMAGDMKKIHSIIASETNGMHGKFAIEQTTVVVVVFANDGIEQIH